MHQFNFIVLFLESKHQRRRDVNAVTPRYRSCSPKKRKKIAIGISYFLVTTLHCSRTVRLKFSIFGFKMNIDDVVKMSAGNNLSTFRP